MMPTLVEFPLLCEGVQDGLNQIVSVVMLTMHVLDYVHNIIIHTAVRYNYA